MLDVYIDDDDLALLFEGKKPKGKPKYQEAVIKKFKQKIQTIAHCSKTEDFYRFNSLNFEALQGDKAGLFSIRVDNQYRLEFSIERIMEGEIVVREILRIIRMSNHYA
ncbi:type II toxin-antitoxin system RelE/ParE family toxin [Cytophagaceae bacterium DM2B3-1]|uniref:Type II toxin-antitoxin system RelE/ParE family toxin n=1 Tax=Xanthocytophaga flava TaxID=3048013 RepID=A0ABT7CLE5_9BACT|nr:type II toxin-antitoxin system RelE/ParE family toxin [Xanthocytophaga flavus]MDJ1494518.1 type II toxin-antitoxin system RelE/ParE family toxin [Xanthocytophaga flavus]